MTKHIAIIGCGPCGLIAAETLASSGYAVTVYDRMPSVGRKLLMAGRGGLNITHSEPLERFITRYGTAAEWLAPSLRAFTPEDLRSWCEGLGQETFIGTSGRVFPRAMKAAPLLRAWLLRLEQRGVRIATRHQWRGWQEGALHFENANGESIFVTPDATLLALGGASWPRLGADGGWVNILSAEGIAIAPLRPSNCGFAVSWSETFRSRFAGMPLKNVQLMHQSRTHPGEVMLTENGIEGGAIYALSAELREAIAAHGFAELRIDLRPQMSKDALKEKLQRLDKKHSLSTNLRKAGFSLPAIGLLYETTPPAQVKDMSLDALAARLKSLPITLTETSGIARAISTAGGIVQSALNQNFMLRKKPGVFAAGEMLDWEAPTGGYLLQGCFSTGITAAKGIMDFCLKGQHP